MITFLEKDFAPFSQFLDHLRPSKLFILVDENTHELCLPTLLGNLETEIPLEIIEIEAGEDLKTIETTTQLWEILAEFEADRKAVLLNLGGGVITDLGGFVASTYKRGIRFINMPTTLLGMCDASIGGKTGIDHQFLKNIVGTFAEAEQIFVFPDFLSTLPFTELRSGFAEMLKHGLIADEKHWKDLSSITDLTPQNIAPYLETSMRIKQNVVGQDFREQHIRKTLNFGHTIGHAAESLFLQMNEPVAHGEAVALGMICETRLSFLQNLITEETADHIISNIRKFFPKLDISAFSEQNLISLMQNDKKNTGGYISFSLIDGVGSGVFDQKISDEIVISALQYYQNLT
ncbi:3-dehydroquinate synthase [Flavobacteriaceae bacterium 3519-10]|nr:3-dehydroquinate synthase [Flavobacteriaceae bacterium 3519-10]